MPGGNLECIIKGKDNSEQSIQLKCCVQTATETKYLMCGGVLSYILAQSFDLVKLLHGLLLASPDPFVNSNLLCAKL